MEVILRNGKIRDVTTVRQSVINKALWERNTLNYTNYDERSARNWNAGFVEDSLDLEARATQNLLIRAAREWPEQNRHTIGWPAFWAAITNYEVGNLDDGDDYLALGLKECQPGQRRGGKRLDRAIETLISVGRINEAAKALDLAVANGSLQIFSADGLFKPLAIAQLKNNKAEAVSTLDKFIALVKKTPNIGVGDRKWAADLYEKAGEYNKAEEVYSLGL
ncbi:MAG TPA: hypothetical protein V6C72_13900, partial [Chroococcales cyanobacterium]